MATPEKYALGEMIGSGPSCDVCRAYETDKPSRPLVVKRLREEHMADPASRESFLKSIDRWSGLRHDRLVEYLDLNRAIGAVVYEWRPFNAASLLRQSATPPGKVLEYAQALFAALAAMHDKDLVHLNIKPSNLLFDETRTPSLADGFCRNRGVPVDLPPRTNQSKYLAPEVIDPRIGEIDAASDVYCLAFVLLEMLCGPAFSELFPWNADDPADADPLWKRWHTDRQLPAPSASSHDGISPAISRFFDKALSKEPMYRFQEAREALEELNEALAQSQTHSTPAANTQPPSPVEPARSESPRPAPSAYRPSEPPAAKAPTPAPAKPRAAEPTTPATPPVRSAPPQPAASQPAPAPPPGEGTAQSIEDIQIGDIPDRPAAPVILRFVGANAEMVGLSTDYFSIGNQNGCEVKLPAEMDRGSPVLLRFSRGVEGWRVSVPEDFSFFLNQERCTGLTPLRSGDVIRLSPGEAGVQFTIVHQNAEPLSKLVGAFAPRLLGQQGQTSGAGAREAQAPDDAAAPRRFSAGGPQQEDASHSLGAPLPQRDSGEWDMITKSLVVVLVALVVTALAIVAWPAGSPDAAPETPGIVQPDQPARPADQAAPSPNNEATSETEPPTASGADPAAEPAESPE